MNSTASTERLVRNTFYGLLLLFVIWIFAIPEFPTLDGPLHLYYAHVLGKLLSGDQHFQQYYQIRHYLPPYSTHIYLFLALERLFPLALVTKTMTTICFVLNAVGLRFLIRSINQRDSVFSLFGIPLGLSWPLFMGFFPYLLGLGIAFFAAGLWCRVAARPSTSNVTGFLLLVALLVFTHPVDLLLLMLFCTSELGARYFRNMKESTVRPYWSDISVLIAAALLCSYVLFFVGSNAQLNEPAVKQPVTVVNILTAEYVSPFIGPASYVLRLALVLLLFFLFQCSIFGITNRFRSRTWDTSDVLCILGTLLLVITPLLPYRVNGGAFFSQRLLVVVWLIFIVSAGAHLEPSFRTTRSLSAVAIALSLLTLGLAHSRVMSVAREVETVPQMEPSPNRVGVLFAPFPDPPENQFWFNPFILSGAKIFLQTDAVLLNAPWLVSPASPLLGKLGTITDMNLGHPVALALTFRDRPELRDRLMKESDLAVISGYKSGLQSNNESITNLLNSRYWSCQRHLSYVICLRKAKE